ncbi:hypothetical protein A3D00_03950 [Candidatus Woesebacteria bacterium RIFCSPHIGHO2_02_FULL_38_9]|uniref:Excinuclease ABC subunit C n=1 Tax=Candidatus Woesebacteria bacterium RIFCSPHIGHO2_01_FULL_39_28 TaxID=1802496 RepID=A0A1F7YJ12_9BACT|nr:MAG: hypothetical protein A2627_03265 [Candidatus Woesebacteria bacterium RIFCSPHIGHO2_01_FULL_39_28]OGM31819.1 MAG: hypothetical protein A3D00_03950 [Candidatus Woesebacteria bacterium RIFCSPHIGHO2_02_FULL_38_9]OGM56950.1 MAG: hypothetical protein A3A50_03610 [Candidatus Woesebacteria bacterium RIFCSPLOWO2_01_FULL_38_20]
MKSSILTKKIINKTPEVPGIYIFRNYRYSPIYIGKAKNLRRRLSSYFQIHLEPKTALMISNAKFLSTIMVDNEFEALLLEAKLVRDLQPTYNIELKDDKSPLYIAITKEKYPRIFTSRRPQINRFEIQKLYGPFTEPLGAKSILWRLRKIFPFSGHLPTKKPCFYSQIGLCNPCPSTIFYTKDLKLKRSFKIKYLKNISNIKRILSGESKSLANILKKEMDDYSKKEMFEEAKILKNQLEKLEYLTQTTREPEEYLKNPNLLEDVRQKEREDLKKLLNKHFRLKTLERIECYDIAHFAGSYPTASMVTFINGEPEKTLYRHFRIRTKKTKSDTDMIKEVFERRMKHSNQPDGKDGWGNPNLIIVDGGKPQAGTVSQLIKDQIPVMGLAKKFETIVIKKDNTFVEMRLPIGPALNFLMRIRDESHRFARRYHHKLIKKSLTN